MNLTRRKPKMSLCLGGVSPFNGRNNLTTCFGIYIPETAENLSIGIIIDNGTGIHKVNHFMDDKKPDRIIQLQTHLHLDHTMGLRFNTRLFTPGGTTHCLIPAAWMEKMVTLVQQPFHPVNMKFGCESEFTNSFDAYGVKIETYNLPHPPEGSLGFKITTEDKVLVVATDCEFSEPAEQEHFTRFTSDADILLLDMEYSDDTYKTGWGHNTPRLITQLLSRRANLGGKPLELIIVHRDPDFPRWDHDRNQIKNDLGVAGAMINVVQSLDCHTPNFY